MAAPKTKPTPVSVTKFVATVENETRRADAQKLLTVFKKVTRWKSRMWGPTIVGFGVYHYTYASGHSGTSPTVGFSRAKPTL